MEIKGVYGVITDNTQRYLEFVESCIQHADPEADIKIYKKEDKIDAYVTPSNPEFKDALIYNLLHGHRHFNLTIVFSKSLKIQKNISYSLYFE